MPAMHRLMHEFAWYATSQACVHRPRAQHWQSMAAAALQHITCLACAFLSRQHLDTVTPHSASVIMPCRMTRRSTLLQTSLELTRTVLM